MRLSTYLARYVSSVVKCDKKSFHHLTTFFLSTWWGDSKNVQKFKISQVFLSYLQDRTANLVNLAAFFFALTWSGLKKPSLIFLQSPCQVGMKNAAKYWKDFLLYFTTLETHCTVLDILYSALHCAVLCMSKKLVKTRRRAARGWLFWCKLERNRGVTKYV